MFYSPYRFSIILAHMCSLIILCFTHITSSTEVIESVYVKKKILPSKMEPKSNLVSFWACILSDICLSFGTIVDSTIFEGSGSTQQHKQDLLGTEGSRTNCRAIDSHSL
jgi:hypothetical protein